MPHNKFRSRNLATTMPSRHHAVALACLGLLTLGHSLDAQAQKPATPPSAASAAAATPATPVPAGSPAVQALIEQARHWQQRGRADLATQSWQKLLGVDPRQPDALHGLTVMSIEAGRFEDASGYLNRLRQARPDHPALARLSQQVQSRTSDQHLLTTARQYAQSGQTEAAARAYKQALGANPPSDELAMEYYQTLGGTREGWDEARQGLERLAQAQPGQPGPALAHARHLSYREPTRREAIRRLNTLSTHADVPASTQQEARAAWRQALLWLDARAADAPLMRQYLATAGDDADVRARLDDLLRPAAARATAEARPLDAHQQGLKQAFAALNANDTAAAAERFEGLLKRRPDDADALAGLGIVRMRQERLTEANDLLGRATASAAGARWKPLQRTARHWQSLQEAQAARQRGDLERATQLARTAVESDPKEAEAQTLLGELLAEQGQTAPAEAAYRAVLRQEPRHARATAGLIQLLGASGRQDQAQTMIQQLDAELLGKLGGAAALRAGQLRLQADTAQQRGDLAGAQGLLEQAVAVAPASHWVRLSLGQMLVRQGQTEQARRQLDAFVMPLGGSGSGEVLQARAMLQAELKDWTGALQTLEQVPAAERNADMERLQRRLSVQAQAVDAVALGRAGQMARAQALLQEAETAAGQDTDLVGAVAGARIELGDEARAGQLIRSTLAAQPQAGAGLRLRHAALLLQTRQDAELSGVLRLLATMPLNAAQRREYDDLRLGLALRQADQWREAGDLYTAWETIAPMLQEQPREPRLLMSLARMHSAAGDEAQARGLYEAVLQTRPDDVSAWLGLAGSADGQKDHDTARQALDEARRLAPDSAQVLAQFARHHRAQGQYSKAAEYLRAAIAAEQPGRLQWGQSAPNALAVRPPQGNPFGAQTRAPTPGNALIRPPVAGVAGLPMRPVAMHYEQLPPTGAGLPVAAAATDSPIARSQRWRTPAAAAPAAGTPLQPAAAPLVAATATAAAPVPVAISTAPITQPAGPRTRTRPNKTLADELAEVQSERGRPTVEVGSSIKVRSGEAGRSQLVTVQAPIEGRMPIEEVGQLSVKVMPVALNAGEISADAASRARSGTLALDTTGTAQPGAQQDAGVGLSIGLQGRRFSADIGSTPVGLAVVDAVGGVRYQDELAPGVQITLEGARRAVTDSLLSFGGMVDARTGRTWGGVRATGGRLQLAWEQNDVGVYGYGGAQALTGREVQDNSRVEAGGGGYWRSRRTADEQLEIGLNLGYQHYQRNLSGYTWGHGGYFSPQHLLSLNMPVNWMGRSGRLSWGLQGSAGLQAYREDAAPYFPTDAAAQATLETQATQQRGSTSSYYAARSDSGLVLNLGGALEYQLSRHLDIGTRLGLERAAQYTQGTGSVYLRLSLEPRGTLGGQGLRMPAGPTGY